MSSDSEVNFPFLCVKLEFQISLQTWMEFYPGSDPVSETFYLSVLALDSVISFNIVSAGKKLQVTNTLCL